ncbi:unnamed protein product, partial [Symbiodinium pilosum]
LWVPKAPRLPGPLLSPHVANTALDAFGHAVVDEVLSSSALSALSRQLQEATMYFHLEATGSYLVALWEDGLASPLLGQVVEELLQALPALCLHRLCEARAYKALGVGGSAPGLAPLGADVTMILWVLPS